VPKRLAVALALLGYDAPLRRDVERAMVTAANQHHAHAPSLRQPVPGLGHILRRVRL
jgi:hypothetical protein